MARSRSARVETSYEKTRRGRWTAVRPYAPAATRYQPSSAGGPPRLAIFANSPKRVRRSRRFLVWPVATHADRDLLLPKTGDVVLVDTPSESNHYFRPMLKKTLVVDGLTPVGAYQALRSRSEGGSFLLESVVPGERWGR